VTCWSGDSGVGALAASGVRACLFLGRVGLDLVFVHKAAGCVVMYAVVFLLFVWVDSGLVGFGLELVELVGGASRARHLHILCIVFVLHGVGMASVKLTNA